MKTQSALLILTRVENLIDSAKATVQAQGKDVFWQRDKSFISAVRRGLLSSDLDSVRWAFDQMRNLSQGFGSYCNDLTQLDALLDELYNELAQLIS